MMTRPDSTGLAFREGDDVVLTKGAYQNTEGSHGVFRRLRPDPNWADIANRDGSVHSYPVAWLAHSECASRIQAK